VCANWLKKEQLSKVAVISARQNKIRTVKAGRISLIPVHQAKEKLLSASYATRYGRHAEHEFLVFSDSMRRFGLF
jgi:hypothetical protein